MAEPEKRCMVCAKVVAVLKGRICEPCQDKIRREAMGEQGRASEVPTMSSAVMGSRQKNDRIRVKLQRIRFFGHLRGRRVKSGCEI